MEDRNKNAGSILVFAVTVPFAIAPSGSGNYVARVVKKKHNILIVPCTIEAINNAAVRNQKEKRLTEVTLTFSPKSSPAKLTFKWASIKR